MKPEDASIETRLIHGGHDRNASFGASSTPIFQVSTYHQDNPEHLGKYDYARSDNPTREALETAIADLEGGARGLAFASGMAATSSVLMIFAAGDHLVVGEDVYGGTYRILTAVLKRWGLEATFVDSTDPAAIRAAILAACPEANEVGDRAEAILRAVDALQPGDALLIAGKGHETGQVIKGDIFPFDDVEQASIAVAALDGVI